MGIQEVVVQNTKSKVRKSRNDSMYGITRHDGVNFTGWQVHVYKLNEDGVQVRVFKMKYFKDSDFTDNNGRSASINAKYAAIEYRNEMLKINGMDIPAPVLPRAKFRISQVSVLKNRTRLDPSLYCITRDARLTSKTRLSSSGWRVRTKQVSRYFCDITYGSESNALAVAKEFRDQLLEGYVPKSKSTGNNSLLRRLRVEAGVSQDVAAKWMDITLFAFGQMERGQTKVNPAFVRLFEGFATKKYDPEKIIYNIDLKGIRMKLKKSQSEMTELITGKKSQSPWAKWETGKDKVPGWLWKYIYFIGFENKSL